ncbi:MAG: hypothetical protein ICV60_14760 [Pyrinomonadaceae bacterium]|nr:hypothetical protein [Pyrinomonadaceae bacterium]
MVTKKSSKKSAGKKKSAKKRTSKKGKKKRKRNELVANGNPPVILGGGGSILIYSDQKLVVPAAGTFPPIAGYSYVLVYPDRTKDPVHVHHKRRGATHQRNSFNKATDRVEIETS